LKRRLLMIGLPALALIAGGVVWWLVHESSASPLAEASERVGTRSADPLLERLRKERPQNAEVQFLSARQARLAGRLEEAFAYLRQADSLGWDASRLRRERVLLYARADFPSGRLGLEQLLAADPADAEVLLALGEGELQAGRADLAAGYAGRVLAQAPGDVRALRLRGMVRLADRQLDGARADLEAALSAQPDSLSATAMRLDLGRCLLDLGDAQQALEHFRAARHDDPDNPLAWFGVGRAASYLDRPDEAESAFLTVLKLRPGHVETLLSLAQVVEQRGDLARALGYLEEAESAAPNRLDVNARLVKLLTAMGEHERAAVHEARYHELDPTRKPTPPSTPEVP
jgi:tetratricopeptide (TPR) repeat protein